jgi:outer membrane immunogenic protein
MMQKVLLGIAAILVAGPAVAADLAVKAPAQAPTFMASPWDGLYIGGNVGFRLILTPRQALSARLSPAA